MFAVLGASAPAWERRTSAVFWSGSLLGKERKKYAQCAKKSGDGLIVGDFVSWAKMGRGQGEGKGAHVLPFSAATGPVHLKPLAGASESSIARVDAPHAPPHAPTAGDLRKMTGYKYLIYMPGFSWSSSFQRIISAGAAVFLPSVLQHETSVHVRLRGCRDCFLYYDADDPCASLQAALANTSDAAAKGYAARLNAYVAAHFQLEATLDYTAEVLNAHAASSAMPAHTLLPSADGDVLQLADGTRLTRVTCERLKASHRAHVPANTHWQLDQWFDDDCLLKPTPEYLSYVSL